MACSGCATPYQARSGWLGGYEDVEVSPGLHQVRVQGNSFTSWSTLQDHAKRRATELCPLGYEVQDVQDRCTTWLGCEQQAVTLTVKCGWGE